MVWFGRTLQVSQCALTHVDKYIISDYLDDNNNNLHHSIGHSQYVHSRLLKLISHFCVNFLVNPPDVDSQISVIFFNKSVWQAKILVELISITLLESRLEKWPQSQ